MVLIIALAAILLVVVVRARRLLMPTPAEWAWDQANSEEEVAREAQQLIKKRPPGLSEESLRHQMWSSRRRAKRYRRLAEAYGREGAAWAESNMYTPYENKFARGEPVASMIDVSVPSAVEVEARSISSTVVISARSVFTVVNDPAWKLVDNDLLFSNRSIDVQILEGPCAGRIISIERAFLRRVPK
jgi:hypothetical protein